MRQSVFQAMQNHDELVVEFEYTDSQGQRSRRVVSPIRFLAENRFLALCLTREEPRQFYFDRCANLQLRRACDYVMPVAI